MKILYLCYWGIKDPLSQSTVYPNLMRLAQLEKIQKIIVVSIEREPIPHEVLLPQHEKLDYTSLASGLKFSDKLSDFMFFPHKLHQFCEKHKIDAMLGRGALAGSLLYLTWKKNRISFYVESFEPHSQYMADSGVWMRKGLKYLIQNFLERKQMENASGLMPVSTTYLDKLKVMGVSEERIQMVPCTVEIEKFKFSQRDRIIGREQLGFLPGDIVGIYVGKFGDIYHSMGEAFVFFKQAFNFYGVNFRLILLSKVKDSDLALWCENYSIPKERIHVFFVNHDEVSAFLSISDFAYALITPGPSKKYCSAIKIGEYWANGLPILIPEGIGDDSEIINKEQVGCILKEPFDYFEQLNEIIKDSTHRTRIAKLAERYRSTTLVNQAYNYFFPGSDT